MAALAATVVSCSQEDASEAQLAQNDAATAIQFGTMPINNYTRAEITSENINSLDDLTMKVWGWVQPSGGSSYISLFNGQKVVRNTNDQSQLKWSYSPLKYWNNGASYKFIGVIPSNDYVTVDDASSDAAKITIDNIPLSAWAATGQDYMVAKAITFTYPTTKEVDLDFQHVLSKLTVSVKAGSGFQTEQKTSTNTKMMLKSFKLYVPSSTLTAKYEQTANTAVDGTWAWNGSWTYPGKDNFYSTGTTVDTNLQSYELFAETGSEDGTTVKAGEITETAQTSNAIFLAPASDSQATTYIWAEVVYSISYDGGKNYNEDFKVAATPILLTETTGHWAQGTSYTLNVTVEPNAITFGTQTVTGWTEATPATEVTVPTTATE